MLLYILKSGCEVFYIFKGYALDTCLLLHRLLLLRTGRLSLRIFLHEFLDPTRRVNDLLFAGKKWMAV